MYFVNQRWLGGLLTNFVTIQKSIKRFRELETMKSTGQYDLFSKKEVARYERERKKLEKNLSGIKEMGNLPDAIFVIDTRKEGIAIQEARKLGIPIIGVADTNADPDEIDYVIPGNDDALRAIRLIAGTIAQAYLDGKAVYEAQQKELAEEAERQRQLQAQQAAAARESAARAAAARRAAEGKEAGETPAPTEGAAPQGEQGRPKTTMRKALQRKAKPRREGGAGEGQGESAPHPQPTEAAPQGAGEPEPAQPGPTPAAESEQQEPKEAPEEQKLPSN
jgi:small subunit ribosomal protein S2